MGYTPLRITTIKPNKELTFDLYIFFKEQFLRYVEVGKSLEEPQLEKLRVQKIARFFITDEHETNYQQFLDSCLQEAVSDPGIPMEEKVELAEGAAGTAVEKMQSNPNSRSAYTMTESAAVSLRKIVSQNPGALKKIFGTKASKNDAIIKHSLNVSALATKLAEFAKCSEQELDNLATAALLHDIGITKMSKGDQELFNKPREKFTPEDKRIWNFHPKDSADMLNGKSYVNKDIIELVLNHEENLSGHGPQKKTKLSTLEEILSLVDSYDLRVSISGMTPKEAVKDMQINELGNYNLNMLNNFLKVVKEQGLV